jgi:hypothetical protein
MFSKADRLQAREIKQNSDETHTIENFPGGSWDACTIYDYAINVALTNINWYRSKKKRKQFFSSALRCLALLLVLLGGICPLLPVDIKKDFGSYGYFLLALGGGLLLFDRLFGLSSSWMRFMLAAQELEAHLDVFRVDWATQTARGISHAGDTEEIDTRYDLVKDFLINVHRTIERETNEWKAEFQKNIVHFETFTRQPNGRTGDKLPSMRKAQ